MMNIARALAAGGVMLALAILTACAPRVQQPLAFDGTVPEITSARHAAPANGGVFLHYRTTDGALLPMRAWMPATQPVRAVVLALHGFNDYHHAFTLPAQDWAALGIATYAYDQRGFGATADRGVWAGDLLAADAAQALNLLRARHPDAPLYLLGESMGGAVAVQALTSPASGGAPLPELAGVVLVAPAVWGGQYFRRAYRTGLWVLAHTVPWKRLTGRGLRILASDNLDILRALGRDPLVIKGARADAAYKLMQLMDAAYHAAPQVRQPVLLLYGQHDQIVPCPPVHTLVRRMAAARTQHAVPPTEAQPLAVGWYPHGYHLLLRDTRAHLPRQDIAAWMLGEPTATTLHHAPALTPPFPCVPPKLTMPPVRPRAFPYR